MPEHTSRGAGEDESELVPVCPECDSTGVRKTVRDTTDHDYYCRDCSVRPIEPEMRERKRKPRLRGLAGRLDSMNPDDVGDGDGRLLTDAGREALTAYAKDMTALTGQQAHTERTHRVAGGWRLRYVVGNLAHYTEWTVENLYEQYRHEEIGHGVTIERPEVLEA